MNWQMSARKAGFIYAVLGAMLMVISFFIPVPTIIDPVETEAVVVDQKKVNASSNGDGELLYKGVLRYADSSGETHTLKTERKKRSRWPEGEPHMVVFSKNNPKNAHLKEIEGFYYFLYAPWFIFSVGVTFVLMAGWEGW